jgi:RecA/RadA recombinase
MEMGRRNFKNPSIRVDVYNRLIEHKRPDESLSDFLDRLLDRAYAFSDETWTRLCQLSKAKEKSVDELANELILKPEEEIRVLPRDYEKRYVKTSSNALNQLFLGWGRGTINTIFGEARTGKSTLIMDAIINAYDPEKKNQRFFVIDTEQGFNLERFKEIIRLREFDGEILNRVIYNRVESFAGQHNAVMMIPKVLKSEGIEPGLIAIDSFINYYHHQLCAIGRKYRKYMMVIAKELQGRLSTEINRLFQIAQRYNCPIILTSWPKSTFGRRQLEAKMSDVDLTRYYLHGMTIDLSMLGGKRLEYLSKVVIRTVRLLLHASAVILVKHLEVPTDYYTWFTITKTGVDDVRDEEMRKVRYITHLYDFMEKLIPKKAKVEVEEVPEEELKRVLKETEIGI